MLLLKSLMLRTLIRIATFENGILTFEKAVNEYAPVQAFTNFYLLKTEYGTMFVSQWLCRYILVEKNQSNKVSWIAES